MAGHHHEGHGHRPAVHLADLFSNSWKLVGYLLHRSFGASSCILILALVVPYGLMQLVPYVESLRLPNPFSFAFSVLLLAFLSFPQTQIGSKHPMSVQIVTFWNGWAEFFVLVRFAALVSGLRDDVRTWEYLLGSFPSYLCALLVFACALYFASVCRVVSDRMVAALILPSSLLVLMLFWGQVGCTVLGLSLENLTSDSLAWLWNVNVAQIRPSAPLVVLAIKSIEFLFCAWRVLLRPQHQLNYPKPETYPSPFRLLLTVPFQITTLLVAEALLLLWCEFRLTVVVQALVLATALRNMLYSHCYLTGSYHRAWNAGHLEAHALTSAHGVFAADYIRTVVEDAISAQNTQEAAFPEEAYWAVLTGKELEDLNRCEDKATGLRHILSHNHMSCLQWWVTPLHPRMPEGEAEAALIESPPSSSSSESGEDPEGEAEEAGSLSPATDHAPSPLTLNGSASPYSLAGSPSPPAAAAPSVYCLDSLPTHRSRKYRKVPGTNRYELI